MTATPGLYHHQRNARMKSLSLLLSMFLPIYLLILLFTLPMGVKALPHYISITLALGSTGTALCVWIIYHYQRSNIAKMTGAVKVTRKEEPRLYNLMEALCISRGQTMPQLQLMETPAINAYTVGFAGSDFTVAVTRGLLKNLENDELEAVLAHELSHIRNGDAQLISITNAATAIPRFIYRMNLKLQEHNRTRRLRPGETENDRQSEKAVIAVYAFLVKGAVDMSEDIQDAHYLSRDILADAGAVELVKDADALVRALRKARGRHQLRAAPPDVMKMCFCSAFGDGEDTEGSAAIEKRIEAMVEVATGRDVPLPKPTGDTAATTAASSPAGSTEDAEPPASNRAMRLELCLNGKTALKTSVGIAVGRQMLKGAHVDAQYLSEKQFILQRETDGGWTITPITTATNQTIVDGRKLEKTTRLKDGMRISVGNISKGTERLPLIVRMHQIN